MRVLPEPLNAEERMLYGICERLDVLIDLLTQREEPKVLEGQITIEEAVEEVPESNEDRILRELLERKDYENMMKDQLLIVLGHRADADASKYMKKDELIQMAKDTDPDKEG